MTLSSDNALAAVLVFGVIAAVVIFVMPLITIWSLNTLFSLSIPMNLQTWFATAALQMCLGNGVFLKGLKKGN